MKWLKLVKNPPLKVVGVLEGADLVVPDSFLANSDWSNVAFAPIEPEPEDIPVALALEALIAQGVHVKSVTLNANHQSDEHPEVDFNIKLVPKPGELGALLKSLAAWCDKNASGGKT